MSRSRNSAFTELSWPNVSSPPVFTAQAAFRYYQHPLQNAAFAGAPFVHMAPITQAEVAKAQAASSVSPLRPHKRNLATGNENLTRKGKKKAEQAGNHPSSYGYIIPPISPYYNLTPSQALYEFPHPYTPGVDMPVLVQWLHTDAPVKFPEKLDLIFVVCWKVPEERIPDVLEGMQRPLPESLSEEWFQSDMTVERFLEEIFQY